MTYLLARVMTAIAILTVLAVPTRLLAAQAPPPYVAIDLGTLGGPNAFLDLPGQPMNARGDIVGQSDTATILPGCGCYNDAGFVWSHGVMAGLGQLPNGFFGGAFSISNSGSIVGLSFINTIDPALNFPEARAVLWKNGQAIDLGTLPGGTESNAFFVNDQGLVTGPSNDGVPDPYSCQIFICWPNQTRGFVWQDGVMKDMGTLGGPDTLPLFINNQGQIAGVSYINNIQNQDNGPGCASGTGTVRGPAPTLGLFLWQNGHMRNLGSLGGTCTTFGGGTLQGLNSRGEVVGQSNLKGNQTYHPVLWDGTKLSDLGTLGGNDGSAFGVNDAGAVVGEADLAPKPDGTVVHHGFLWKNGSMTDLPPFDGALCSIAHVNNNQDQVVGTATDCQGNSLGAMLWQNGKGYDLNTLIVKQNAPSPLFLVEATSINDRGEILANAVDSHGNARVALLVPANLTPSLGLASTANAHAMSAPARPAVIPASLRDPGDMRGSPHETLSARFRFRTP